jgi:hypothetical protein
MQKKRILQAKLEAIEEILSFSTVHPPKRGIFNLWRQQMAWIEQIQFRNKRNDESELSLFTYLVFRPKLSKLKCKLYQGRKMESYFFLCYGIYQVAYVRVEEIEEAPSSSRK